MVLLDIKIKEVKNRYIKEVNKLYVSAFPKEERRPIKWLIDKRKKNIDFFVIADKKSGDFIGFSAMLTVENKTHILYFAIKENLRLKGFGSDSLKLIHDKHKGNIYLADIESVAVKCDNLEERKFRYNFYLKNGYIASGVCYQWQKVDYEIMAYNGTITESEYDAFWDKATIMINEYTENGKQSR